MRRQIPSLSALESFEAVARHGSTTRAAKELGRAQSAVSRQILNLEGIVARPLFTREHNRLVLNGAGQYLFEAIGAALDRLAHAVERSKVLGSADYSLVLRVWPTIGARWLMSRLAVLPIDLGLSVELAICIETTADLPSVGADATILYGSGTWPGLASYRIITEELVAVAAPGAVGRFGTDVSAHPWIHWVPRPGAWHRWVQDRAEPGTKVKPGPAYQISMVIEMACLAQGAAVLPKFYVERELAAGSLVAPFGQTLSTGRGYYLCATAEAAEMSAFVAFKDWLLSTC